LCSQQLAIASKEGTPATASFSSMQQQQQQQRQCQR
jgi:hypothetical protein